MLLGHFGNSFRSIARAFGTRKIAALSGILILTLGCVSAVAQTHAWTWMGGSNTFPVTGGIIGVYGTLGVPASSNQPGGRYGAATWTDKNGNFWLMGGEGFTTLRYEGADSRNDLWEFNPSTQKWTWMSGSNGANTPVPSGVYGTLGVPASTNTPGGRKGAASWTDQNGNLWLWGGLGYDSTGYEGNLNDMWEYNPVTKLWTWMGGSKTVPMTGLQGVSGTLGTPGSGNIPGGRMGEVTWTDSSGNFWMFGGNGFDAKLGNGYLNDLWKFNPSTKEWAWMGGDAIIPITGQTAGVYGTLGAATTGNIPGARTEATAWTDQSGNFWMFGGLGYDAQKGNGYLNDLWKYNPSTGKWAWMSGSNTKGKMGAYGTPSAANVPQARYLGSGWVDGGGNLWLFGGQSFDANGYTTDALNDLWVFYPSTQSWAWMAGSSTVSSGDLGGQAGTYGTLLVPGSTNSPGSRSSAANWTDNSGNLWLFGGNGWDSQGTLGHLNDVWRYQPPAISQTATPTFSVASGTYSTVQTVTISDATAGAVIYYTTNGTLPTTSSTKYTGAITVSSTETIEAIAVAAGYTASSAATATYTLQVAAPSFSPLPGVYATTQSVTLADATPGAVIYFTTNGTQPTTSSTKYVSSISVSASETVKAIATATGFSQSTVSSGQYIISASNTTPTVTVTPSASSITTAQGLNVSVTVSGGTGKPIPTGSVTLTSGSYSSAASTLSNGSTLITIAAGGLATGSDTLTARYTPDSGSSSIYISASGTAQVTVTAATSSPVPVIASLSPAYVSAGTTAFSLAVAGSGFTSGSTVYLGTTALTTQYVSANQVVAQITAAEVATAGISPITVQTAAPGGGTSNVLQFEVDSALAGTTAPTFSSATATVVAGSTATYMVALPTAVSSASVTCLNLPSGATCSYSATANTVTIATSPTTPRGTYPVTVVFTETVSGAAIAGILLPILLLPLAFLRRKLAAKSVWITVCLGLVMTTALFSIGCGGGGSTQSSPTNQTHQVTSSSVVSITVQ